MTPIPSVESAGNKAAPSSVPVGRDNFILWPFCAALVVVVIWLVLIESLRFTTLMLARETIPFALLFWWLACFGFGLVIIWMIGIALFKLRFRRLISLACAIIPFLVIAPPQAVLEVPPLSPFYWYVLLNEAQFESKVSTSHDTADLPLVLIETRDVSTGILTNIFQHIVFDASDELLHPRKEWSGGRKALLEQKILVSSATYTVMHLHGHFYLVTEFS